MFYNSISSSKNSFIYWKVSQHIGLCLFLELSWVDTEGIHILLNIAYCHHIFQDSKTQVVELRFAECWRILKVVSTE